MARSAAGRGEVPAAIPPMLAEDARVLPAGPGWVFEWKWDGWRACLAVAADGTTRLTSRNGNDLTTYFPELGGVLRTGRAMVLDGEVVALNEHARPEFGRLQRRRTAASARLAASLPVHFFAFDLLVLGGESLLERPYTERRDRLDELRPPASGRIVVPPCYPDAEPDDMLKAAIDAEMEGVVAKKAASPYRAGRRSPDWRKHAVFHSHTALIGAWRPGGGRRSDTVGALLLGAHDAAGDLVYIGDVGTGFSEATLADLLDRLQPLERARSPFSGEVPRDRARGVHWVAPQLACDVTYRNFTPDQRLRHTSFRGLRWDKDHQQILVPGLPSP
ncbi:non-homologous end-joining DNA ligase [Amycolatopsis magusensis]|uniref:DNA ligase (ATP) n=1 Tax=Amycolatopsis magusensis TaxID=882444 RepID=A0ABS4Q1U2_9PSEU|nr:non-homologous end-joining DNA ligase [Amycolatopsis magusensis]MBP2185652.1 bifunctional non-homologous end joining protein LigD [Amycolatopsis magusensis]